MIILKRVAAIILALAIFGLVACKPAEEGPGSQTAAPGAEDGAMVYAESSLELDSILSSVEEMRTIADGSLMGIGVDYEAGKYMLIKLDENGKIVSSADLFTMNSDNVQRMYTIDSEGSAYVLEMDMSAFWGSAPTPLEEPTPEGEEEADDAVVDDEAAQPSPKSTTAPNIASYETDADGNEISTAPAETADEPVKPDNGLTSANSGVSKDPILRRYDSSGALLSEATLPPLKMAGEAEFQYPDTPYRIGADPSAGVFYTLTNRQLSIFDMNTGELKREVSSQSGASMQEISVMGDGFIFAFGYEENGMSMRCLNPLTGEERWSRTTNNYPENLSYSPSDGKLYGKLGRKIVSYDNEGNEQTLLELTDFSVLSPFYWMRSMVVGKNGTVFCILSEQSNREKYILEREKQLDELEAAMNKSPDAAPDEIYQQVYSSAIYSSSSDSMRMTKIALTDAAGIKPKTEITVSVMYEDYSLMSMIGAFHATNPDIRVRLKEMIPSEELSNPDVDFNQLIQRVNTEIISGKAADILMMSGLPFDSYGKKNILEDLLPYMQSDPDFDMANYRSNVLDAFKINGKLFALPTGFSVPVILSKKGEFTQPELTTADFFEKLFKLKAEELPMEYATDATSLFYTLLYSNIEQFTDNNGNIALDTPEFIAFLENIKKADELYKNKPVPEDNGMYPASGMAVTRAIAAPAYDDDSSFIMDFSDIYGYYAASSWKSQYSSDFELRFVPSMRLPNTKGFSSYTIYGMNRSSKQKDAAWQFLKFLISEQMQASDYGVGGCPVNIKAGDKLVSLMLREADLDRRQYALDQQLNSRSAEAADAEDDQYYKMYLQSLFTQADADMIDQMLGKVDTLLSYDTTIITMANEEIEPYLKGQKSAAETAKTLQSRLSMYISEKG